MSEWTDWLELELATTERKLEMAEAEWWGPGAHKTFAISNGCGTGNNHDDKEEGDENTCGGCGCGCHFSIEDRLQTIQLMRRHFSEEVAS